MVNNNNQLFIETPDNVLYDVFLKWLNEDTIKKIENEISIIMEDSNESTNDNKNVDLKNA